ncbi:hypothetical protein [Pseudanabaena sp. ABRG5-3]|uniref:hypothetical protein n=1 Tax=Pseudanabaena sp. ABRG5-3 TaxID=685565 RepID=UPI000DC715BF|nr:hypothetical protein [Pseudanabaena sp. ABRG5-3]BBC23838.1 bacteriochlorophyll 4-vinyl reductase [Pseudanabaena sp. ABRG5-3]
MTNNSIPGNYFSPRFYVKSDPATGLLSTRQGDRLIAIPDFLLRSIHRALQSEAGQAGTLALYTFGFGWGGSFYDHIRGEIESYKGATIMATNAVEFLATMRQLWTVHGMGTLTLDFSHRQHGLIVVTTENSVLTTGSEIGLQSGNLPWHQLQAGFIAAWFSRWAGKDIRACATDWSAQAEVSTTQSLDSSTTPSQDNYTRFIVGINSKIQQVEPWVKQGLRTTEILDKLTAN